MEKGKYRRQLERAKEIKRPPFCYECESHFDFEAGLELHNNQVHYKNKLVCDTCKNTFRSLKELQSHQDTENHK